LALILDTGAVFALLDRSDRNHRRCRELIEAADETLVLPGPTLPEIDTLVYDRLGVGPILALMSDVRRGAYAVEDLELEDYGRIADLMDRYADLGLGFVDSSIITIAERLGETRIATLDHRHFSAVRPRHADALELLPS
jgi:predicted nucleic acid-binding protein